MFENDANFEVAERTAKLFMSAHKKHRMAFDRFASHYGMHRGQHRILMHICKCGGGLSQKQLALDMEVSPAAMTVMLNKLMDAGYIVRETIADDSRINIINPTEKGKALAEESCKYFESIDMLMFDGFDKKTLVLLGDLFERMADNLSKTEWRGDFL